MSELIPDDVYRAYLLCGEEWADMRGAADLLEGTLKSLKAQISLEAKQSRSCGIAESESIALSSPRYRDALSEAVQARMEANKGQVRFIAIQALFEARRSAEASNRAAMRAGT